MRTAKATGSILAQNIRADKVIRTNLPGVFKFRLGFFYRHGMTAEKYAERVASQFRKKWGLEAEVLDCRENWQPWPRDSYWEATVKVQFTRVQVDDDLVIHDWLP